MLAVGALAVVPVISKKNNSRIVKADEINEDDIKKDYVEQNVIPDCIKTIREQNSNCNITINNTDDLYSEFEKVSELTDKKTMELLETSSDKVLEEYLKDEIDKAFSISKNMENDDIKDENISEIDEEYFEKEDDTKVEKVATTKYGTKITAETIDESETVSKLNWIKTPVKWSEVKEKPYGDRRFKHKISVKIAKLKIVEFWVAMGYTVSDAGLKERYVDGNFEWLADSVFGFNVCEKKMTNENTAKIGGHIDGYVMFKFQTCKIPLGVRYRYNLKATIKKWDKSKKTMKVEHFYQEWVDLKI